jgi:hypothetical protein
MADIAVGIIVPILVLWTFFHAERWTRSIAGWGSLKRYRIDRKRCPAPMHSSEFSLDGKNFYSFEWNIDQEGLWLRNWTANPISLDFWSPEAYFFPNWSLLLMDDHTVAFTRTIRLQLGLPWRPELTIRFVPLRSDLSMLARAA